MTSPADRPPVRRFGLVPASFLQAIVEASPDGVLAVSPDRRILAVNRRFQQMWDLPDDVVQIGGASPALTRDQRGLIVDPEAFEAAIVWGHEHAEQPQTLTVHLTDGRVIEGYADGIIDDDGAYLGRVWYMSDATARLAGEQERTALTEQLATAEHSQRFLLRAADALARTTGFFETLQALAEVAVPTLGDLCLIDVTEDFGGIARVAALHADPERRALATKLRMWPPDPAGSHPSVVAMRERRSHWSTEMPQDFLASTTRNAEHLALLSALEFRGYMAVPLIAADQVLGAVTFVSSGSERIFAVEDLRLAEDFATRMALVVAKERRYDREREASHLLQASLLPRHELAVPGVEVAVRYLPGTRDAEVGGDFWDYAGLADGEVALVVGDVAGHDMVAAAQMAQLRSVCRALQTDGPAELLDAVQRSWDRLGLDRLATAVFARLNPATGRLRLACAGHPPPVIVADGQAFLAPVEPVPPLGAPAVPSTEWEGVLPPGGAVVFYTDGLVESNERDVDEGTAALLTACRESPEADPEALADRVLRSMTAPERSDDVAVLVVRRSNGHTSADRGSTGSAGLLAATSRTKRFPATPASASTARRFVLDALLAWGMGELMEEAALCTAELATNAILHSRGEFTVAARRSPSGIRVDVQDDRPERLPLVVPDSFAPLDTGITGRGLMLVAAIARRWGYFTTDVAKTVWFELEPGGDNGPTSPIIEVVERPQTPDAFAVRLVGMPVQAAIASGVQVDELVREVQLDPQRLSADERDVLHGLLDRSARPRLVGRQEAFRAAAEGREEYTLVLSATPDEAAAVAELGPLLARLATSGEIEAAAVDESVLAMRQWINAEIAAQAAGGAPTPYGRHSER